MRFVNKKSPKFVKLFQEYTGPQYDNSLWGFDVGIPLLMPIPLSEMDSNPEMLKSGQNTGY